MSVTVLACGDQPGTVDVRPPVTIVEGLCKDPDRITGVGAVSDRVVLILHANAYDLAAVQKALRAVDVDPIGAQIIDVVGGSVVSSAAIEGASARARAFSGTSPEHVKPVVPTVVTRRGFLRSPALEIVAVPRIEHRACMAPDGCRACVESCPRDAYRWQGGRIAYDKDACVSCGVCVTACPVGAIENPTVTPAMLEAQVRAIIGSADEAVGIRFVCSRGHVAAPQGWFDVDVPCTSMVPGTWLLACLLLGAGAATAVPCGRCGCPLGLDDGAIQANDLAHTLLASVDLDPGMVSGTSIYDPIPLRPIEDPFSSDNAPYLVLALASTARREVDVVHPASNIGVVEIDASVCTLCGQCAQSCPTHALVETYDGDTVSITFDAHSCVNCTQCVMVCPEARRSAITVTGRISTTMLDGGRLQLIEGTIARCEVCRAAIAPAPMMNRISELLGDDYEATMAVLANRCLDCRGRR